MSSSFIFLAIVVFKADAWRSGLDPVEITFTIHSEVLNEDSKYIMCDHTQNNLYKNKYTLLEGEEFKIITDYNSNINHFICRSYHGGNYKYDKHVIYSYTKKSVWGNVTSFKAEKKTNAEMVVWNCTMLADRNNPTVFPSVQYENDTYSVAYCFMYLRVKPRTSPLEILVNNMALQTVYTDLSEKDVDFTAEYRYADGDVVNVTCANFLSPAQVTMSYNLAGTVSDNSTMADLSSSRDIGFVAKLHSGHNNSYAVCSVLCGQPSDVTRIKVTLVMLKEFNVISVKINGMALRPVKDVENNFYQINYKYLSPQRLNVVCEVQRTDMKLEVDDQYIVDKVSNYKKTELIPGKKAEMSFYIESLSFNGFDCLSKNYDINDVNEEQVYIEFRTANFFIDPFPLHMELPSNGIVMELYNIGKLRVIFYEFEDGETIRLKCGPLFVPEPGPAVYLQMKDSDECKENGCVVSKTLYVTRKDDNTNIVCYLKRQNDPLDPTEDKVIKEIRVNLRERVPTTDPASSETSTNTLFYCVSAVGGAVFLILIVLYLSVKKLCCCIRSSSQVLPPVPAPRQDPASVFYLNLLPIFRSINEREEAESENDYEEIQ